MISNCKLALGWIADQKKNNLEDVCEKICHCSLIHQFFSGIMECWWNLFQTRPLFCYTYGKWSTAGWVQTCSATLVIQYTFSYRIKFFFPLRMCINKEGRYILIVPTVVGSQVVEAVERMELFFNLANFLNSLAPRRHHPPVYTCPYRVFSIETIFFSCSSLPSGS